MMNNKNTVIKKNKRTWQLRRTQHHGNQKEMKSMVIKRNTKNITIDKNQDHGIWEEHQEHNN
jgi:hypothetical protein